MAPEPDLNPLPLALTIVEGFTPQPQELVARVAHAAVHGWMEGHLAAPGHRHDPRFTGSMPASPFPDPHDRRVTAIIVETLERFGDGEEPAAVAFAAALGWQQGRSAGAACPGCAVEGWQNPSAQAMRAGTAHLVFQIPGS